MLFIKNYKDLSEIVFQNVTNYAQKSAFSVVKLLCERELFSYESRVKLTNKYLKIKTRIPLYINDKILLIPTKSPRNYDNIWINYFNILKIIKRIDGCEIVFKNLQVLILDDSFNKIRNSFNNAKIINKYFGNINKRFFLEY